ncbi:hypothetical protein [Methanobacterium alcaliphilum]|uniref:hypothetical protein n=1 Tax=Methanobacterium alcaliphilum TaxID=392018 RepID=UPI002009E29C|nr:hypothetical protein [Methanobacterium alcaliphilum]MCK9152438.1 hypothetical protein [Methanobacterium alcaliphilum]
MSINPKMYYQQINDMNIDGLAIDPSSLSEAMSLLVRLKRDMRMLQQIKYNIRMDIRKIRREYLAKLDSLKDPSKAKGIFDKKWDDTEIRKGKKILLAERDDVISPYEGLERLIDYYLDEIESSIAFLNEYIHNQGE